MLGGFPGLPVFDVPTLYGSQTCGKETMSRVSLAVIHCILFHSPITQFS